jgi:hypothetical protein
MRTARLESRRAAALLAASLSAVTLAFAAPAHADIGETIIQRCTHGQSLSGFSQQAYRRALKELSADAEEYTDCASLIRRAQLAAAAGRAASAAPTSVAAVAASPTEQQALSRARSVPGGPVRLDGQVVHPGVVHASIASAFSSLPAPLLAMLAFLLACLLLVGARTLRERVRARRSG